MKLVSHHWAQFDWNHQIKSDGIQVKALNETTEIPEIIIVEDTHGYDP